MAEQDPNVQQEGSFETGSDEFWKAASQNNYNNMKAVFDQMVTSLAGMNEQGMTMGSTLFANTINKSDQLHNLSVQAMQNAIETANMVGKQAVKHSDIAQDRTWNLNETDFAANKTIAGLQDPSVIAAMAAAIAKAMNEEKVV